MAGDVKGNDELEDEDPAGVEVAQHQDQAHGGTPGEVCGGEVCVCVCVGGGLGGVRGELMSSIGSLSAYLSVTMSSTAP